MQFACVSECCLLPVLAQAGPPHDAAFVVQVVLRVLHILPAIILVGGLFYQRTILAPSGTNACFAERRQLWARWVGIATFLLLATGLYNFMTIVNAAKAAGNPLPPTYHALFGIKFLLGLFVMFVAAILAGKTEAAERFRRNLPKWLNAAWLAALAIVVIAAVLRTYH